MNQREGLLAKLLGERLRKARLQEGMSQTELGKKVGVTQGSISNWEKGTIVPKDEQVHKLQRVLGTLTESSGAQPANGAFGAWLRKARGEANLSVAELAAKAGVSIVAIYNIEAGRSQNPQEQTRKRLERALGVDTPHDVQAEALEGQSIEGLSSLTDFDPHDKNDRPKKPGVYVLYDVSDRPIYVGKSQNIAKRIGEHEDKFWFRYPIVSNAAYVEITKEILRHQVEQVLIRFLKSNAVVNKQSVAD